MQRNPSEAGLGNTSTSRSGGILPRVVLVLVIIFVAVLVLALIALLAAVSATPDDLVDVGYIIGSVSLSVGLFVVYLVLLSFPAMLVIGYRASLQETLEKKIIKDLWLCGLGAEEVSARFREFVKQSRGAAFVLPTVVNVALLVIFWGFTLLPNGFWGLSVSLIDLGDPIELTVGQYYPAYPDTTDVMVQDFNNVRFFDYLVSNASLVTWAFLGAYFYTLMVLIRRWLQVDLTAGAIWRVNIRLAVVIVVGLLLIYLDGINGVVVSPYIAFLAGVVPDTVLRWLSDRLKSVFNVEGVRDSPSFGRIFAASDLQNVIGLTFWEKERLLDEGIETIEDLATEEIPDLLIRTRFDTPRLLHWIDCAILAHYVGDRYDVFKKAFILTASDLLDRVKTSRRVDEQAMQEVLDSINPSGTTSEISKAQLANLVSALEKGPNLTFVNEYWKKTKTPEIRREALAKCRNELWLKGGAQVKQLWADEASPPY